MTIDKLMTRSEVARVLKKPESWLRYSERKKIIPFIKVGQQIRYLREDLENWIEKQRVPSVTEMSPTVNAEDNKILGDSIEELNLSTRSFNAVYSAKICLIGELVQQTAGDLKKKKYVGDSVIKDVRKALAEQGLSLGMRIKGDWVK